MSLKITRIDDIRSVSSTVADPSLGFTTMNLHFRDFCKLRESHADFRKLEIVVPSSAFTRSSLNALYSSWVGILATLQFRLYALCSYLLYFKHFK